MTITNDPNIMFGKPVIKGTRIPVSTIKRYHAAGLSVEELCREFPELTADEIRDVDTDGTQE